LGAEEARGICKLVCLRWAVASARVPEVSTAHESAGRIVKQGGSSAVRFKETGGIFDPGPLTKLDEGVRSVHQAIENTAYCLNCTHQWPAMWNLARESTLVSPKCQWHLSVPEEFVSSGWWTTEDEELAVPII
jgi:hypothetical protein